MLELLLPQRCLVCSRPGAQVCAVCRGGLRRIREPLCERCGTPTAWPVQRCAECSGRRLPFVRARAAVEYDEPVRRIVHAWKERGLRRLARWAAEVTREAIDRPQADCVVWVPADPDRRLRRGYHAAEQLGKELAAVWELPAHASLARARTSEPQRGKSRSVRRANVAGAFSAAARVPARIVLVDDVYTTGATAAAAASALRQSGAKTVEIVTFARTIRIS